LPALAPAQQSLTVGQDTQSGGAAQAGILVGRDEDGYLLQIFTRPLGDRLTVFFEHLRSFPWRFCHQLSR
jgi:4-hydroxyphenylpyruvate dioxygenase-like putative hemolysin